MESAVKHRAIILVKMRADLTVKELIYLVLRPGSKTQIIFFIIPWEPD
jgi:hypothetical protein